MQPMEKFKNTFLGLFWNKFVPIRKNEKSDYFNFDLIEIYFKKKTQSHSFQVMPERFLNDVDMQELFVYIGKIDSAISIAAIRENSRYYCKPVFIDTNHSLEFADLYHFTELVESEIIQFDYKLKHGYLYTKNAIRILEINNYPEEIILEAKSISQFLKDKHS